MGFKLLRVFCFFGRIVASTPSSTTTPTEPLFQKIYNLLFFVALSYGQVMTIINNDFYQNTSFVKIIAAYITEFSLYYFSFCTMITINFWKRKKWYDLMEYLRVVKAKTLVVKAKKKKKLPYYFYFMVINIWLIGGEIYDDYQWYTFLGPGFFARFNVRLLELWLQTYHKMLILDVLSTLLVRYQRVTKLLKKTVSLVTLRRTVKTLCLFRKTVDIFNDFFGPSLALTVLFTIFEVLNYILFALSYEGHGTFLDKSVLAFLRLHSTIIGTVRVLAKCEAITEESKRILTKIYEIKTKMVVTEKEELELLELVEYVEENLPVFSGDGFFRAGKPTILNITATVANFLIVVVQVTKTEEEE